MKQMTPAAVERAMRDSLREFLTDDMKSYGDVEIWAYDVVPRGANWSSDEI